MDHLPEVRDPFQPIVVPYLGGPEYDGLGFSGYPARQNWHIKALTAGDLQGRLATEAAQFLQTWLYFGMLHETLKIDDDDAVELHRFILFNGSYAPSITTRQLPQMLRDHYARLRAREGTDVYYRRFRDCMVLACGVWWDLMTCSSDVALLLSHEILLSIQILGAALDIGLTEVLGSRADYTWRVVHRSEWLIERMIRQGWCPAIVEQISHPCATFLYYASLLGPPRRESDHRACSAKKGICIAANSPNSLDYVGKHVEESCRCKHIFIQKELASDIAKAIIGGHIPLVHVTDDGNELSIAIEVHSPSNPIKYTAVSHIWADGLGNPNENSLPRCQLRRITKLVSKLPSHHEAAETEDHAEFSSAMQESNKVNCHFWMDTLCIPVDIVALRNQAIVRMQDVYKLASNVLVLDADLMRSSCDRPFTEIFTRITCSSWLRRLWTLQEGLFNPNLLFQFAERAIYVGYHSHLVKKMEYDNKHDPWNLVAWECHRFNFSMLQVIDLHTPAMQLFLIWDSLANRTTSRRGDEPLCLAIIIGLNIEGIQNAKEEDRVQKFWSLHVHGVPESILFIPGEKLQVPGFGWAPANLLQLRILGTSQVCGQITPRGLRVVYPGFSLQQLQYAPRNVLPCRIDGESFFIRQAVDTTPWSELRLNERKRLGVILLVLEGSAKRHFSGAVVDGTEERRAGGVVLALGALVECEERFMWQWWDSTKYVRYLGLVSVLRKGSFSDEHPKTPWSAMELEEKAKVPVEGSFLLPTQQWCVG